MIILVARRVLVKVLRFQQHISDSLIERLVTLLRVRPVEDTGHLSSDSSRVTLAKVSDERFTCDFQVVDLLRQVLLL